MKVIFLVSTNVFILYSELISVPSSSGFAVYFSKLIRMQVDKNTWEMWKLHSSNRLNPVCFGEMLFPYYVQTSDAAQLKASRSTELRNNLMTTSFKYTQYKVLLFVYLEYFYKMTS